MSDFKVIQKVNIEELNRLASELGIQCGNCIFFNNEAFYNNTLYGNCGGNTEEIRSTNFCSYFQPKYQKEPAPLKTLNIEPYTLDK